MFITVWAATTTANAGPDQTLCNATSFTMAGNAVGAGETGIWVRISGPNNPTITSANSPTTTITGTIPGTYVFRWRITSGTCPYTEDFVTITNRTPITLTGPTNASICNGGTQTLSISASGGTGLYNYQWQFFNVTWNNVGTNTNSYTTPVLSTASYQYRVFVTDQVPSDDAGCSTTGTATVTVVDDPAITVQPTNPADICVGGTTANMTVTATGGTPALNYQWQYFNGSWNNVANGTPAGATYTGATGASMHVSGITTPGAYAYQCIVSATGTDCAMVTSNTVTATVIADPTLTDPTFTNNTICSGGSTVVSSTISGGTGTPSYQWQYWNGSTWNNVANGTPTGSAYTNATTASMTISGTTAAGTYQYRLTTTNSSGCDFNSNSASYTVVADPTINTQPATPANICVGGTSANMTIAATGGTPSLNYQWQYNSGTWSSVADGTPAGAVYSGATGTTFSVSGISVAGSYQYRCLVSATGDGCGTATSTARTLTVVTDPAITSQPGSITICSGNTTTLSVTATGGTPARVYQWQSSPAGAATWTNVGANSASYTTAALTADTDYRVTITATGSDCNAVTSSTATVTVNNLVSGTIAADQTICSGDTPAGLTSTLDASGDGTITYQWESSTTSAVAGFSSIGGAISTTYAPGALTQDTWFRRVATSTLNAVGCTATATAVKVTVNNFTSANTLTGVTVCDNSTASLTGNAVTADGTVTYQWQISADNVTYNNVPSGGTSQNYTTDALTADTYYRRIATSTLPGTPCTLTSAGILVLVNNFTSVNTIGSDQTICSGSTASLTGNAVTADGTITYQWQSSPDNGTYTNVASGGTSQNYTTAALSADTYFRRIATST
jgi:hypothetical protein